MNPTHDSVFRVSPDLPRCTLHVWPDAMLSESSSPALRIRHRFSSAALGVYPVGGITSDSQLLCTAHANRVNCHIWRQETGDWSVNATVKFSD